MFEIEDMADFSIITLRDGNEYMLLDDELYGLFNLCSEFYLNDFKENLNHEDERDCDIVKIEFPKKDGERKLLWERAKSMTHAEIEKELGYKFDYQEE